MRRILALVVVLGLLAVPSSAAAATRWASPGGTNLATCPQADPCDIATALDKVGQPNDEVIVLPGTYTVSSSFIYTQNGMTVHGQDGSPRPVIQTSSASGVLAATGSGSTVRYLELQSNNSSGFALDVQNGSTADDIIAEAQNASGNVNPCETEGGAAALATIANSVCTTVGSGEAVYSDDSDGNYNTTTVRNVTTNSASGAGLYAINMSPSRTVVINAVNTIASGGTSDVQAQHSSTGNVNINLAYSNYDTHTGNDAHALVIDQGHNQSAAPLLTSDWHEMPGSPTIDAGSNDPANGSTDFDGDPRALGSGTTDIGADEYVPAPLVTTGDPTAVGQTTGTLNGTVNPESRGTTYHFDFGTTTSYGSSTPETGVGSGTSPIAVNATLSPIVPGTTYHYRIVATNNVGTSVGPDRQFTTVAPPPVGGLVPNVELSPVSFQGLTLKSQTVTVDKNGNVVLEVACPATAIGNCVGTDTLNTASKVTVKLVAARKKKAKILKLGSAKFSIAPGTKKKLKIKLSKQARSLLAKSKQLKAVETVVSHDSRNVSKTSKTNITLKAPKAKKKKH